MTHPHTAASTLIEEAGHTVIPAVYARIIPSGLLSKEEFYLFLDDFMSYCTDEIDGIWLCLHGAMTVSGIGSGEAYLVKQLRQRYGNEMPIFGSFDLHGNMSLELVRQMNYITAYYTAPHVDIYETGCRAVRALIHCIDHHIMPHCHYIPIPMIMPGELVITDEWPTNRIQAQLRQLTETFHVMELSFFCGFAWSDCPRNRMALTISDDNMDPEMLQHVLKLAQKIWDMRTEFTYGTAIVKEPEDAVAYCKQLRDPKIIISDTGDNVTAGCAGDSALLAELMIQGNLKNALVAGIADCPAVNFCFTHKIGDTICCNIGGTIDPQNSPHFLAEGKLILKNTLIAEDLPTPLRIAVLRIGSVDILICDQRYCVTSRKHINDTGLSYDDYQIIAVKLGYLYPDFAEQHPCSILAVTPGNAYQNTSKIAYTQGPRQYYPRDHFAYIPELDPKN